MFPYRLGEEYKGLPHLAFRKALIAAGGEVAAASKLPGTDRSERSEFVRLQVQGLCKV